MRPGQREDADAAYEAQNGSRQKTSLALSRLKGKHLLDHGNLSDSDTAAGRLTRCLQGIRHAPDGGRGPAIP